MKDTLNADTQQVIREMVEGMLGKATAKELSRINVVFNIENK
jgi:hypothetical protein